MDSNLLHIDEETYQSLQEHLFRGESEQVAFLFARVEEVEDRTAFHVKSLYKAPDKDLSYSSPSFISLTDEAFARVIKKASDSELVPIEVHSHRHDRFTPGFSRSDFKGFENIVPHVRWRLQWRPYIALVFTPSGFDGLVWKGSNGNVEPLDEMVAGGETYRPSSLSFRKLGPGVDEERFDRQIRFFGKEGQEKLAGVKVGIVGLGGLGSHVAQQLSHLGVQDFFLVDGDEVEESNLNRLVGTRPKDAELGRLKIDVAKRMIEEVTPSARVETSDEYLISEESFEQLRSVDVIVGTVDNDASRLVLNELAQAYEIPYLDVATDIDSMSGHFGGRLLFSIEGERCLSCEGELDQSAIDSQFATSEDRSAKAEIYGVPEEELDDNVGPAVVSINGTMASLAVTELLMFITGFRPVQTYLTYDGRYGPYGGVRTQEADPENDCYFCDAIRGDGKNAGVESHYLENEKGQLLTKRLAE